MKKPTLKKQARKVEILNTLTNWKGILKRSSAEPFSTFFAKHAGFKFKYHYCDKTNFTVYFGLDLVITEQKIVVHIIPEFQDESDQAFAHVLTCHAEESLISGVIDKEEALKRIERWQKYAKTWVEENQSDLFKGVSIPAENFEPGNNSFTVYFGLKELEKEVNGEIIKELDFDLILHRKDQGVYLDTVHLIPPLRPGQKAYILSQIPAKTTRSLKDGLRIA